MIPFSTKLGTTCHRSLLLRKAARLGLLTGDMLSGLAWLRGCRWYPATDVPTADVPELSNEELAICLLHPSLPWDAQRLRVAAAMVAAAGNSPEKLAFLAVRERAETPLREIARAGLKVEPTMPFWTQLLTHLPAARELRPKPGIFPHYTRYCSMAGKTGPGPTPQFPQLSWIRPL